MTQSEILLAEIEAFLPSSGLTEATFGKLAVNDGKFVAQLRRGRRCWPETEQEVRKFIASQRTNKRRKPASFRPQAAA